MGGPARQLVAIASPSLILRDSHGLTGMWPFWGMRTYTYPFQSGDMQFLSSRPGISNNAFDKVGVVDLEEHCRALETQQNIKGQSLTLNVCQVQHSLEAAPPPHLRLHCQAWFGRVRPSMEASTILGSHNYGPQNGMM